MEANRIKPSTRSESAAPVARIITRRSLFIA
jgi:hypothetical protein